jgi:hypothetical protein
VYYSSANSNAAQAFSALGFAATSYATNVRIPLAPDLTTDLNSVTDAKAALAYAFPRHLSLPYIAEWNLAIEQTIGSRQSLTASYVGSSGNRLLQEQRLNIGTENPNLSEIAVFPEGLTSNYQSLQLAFQRSLSHGIQAFASYTWSHSLDYGSTSPMFPLVRGNSDLDVRHADYGGSGPLIPLEMVR